MSLQVETSREHAYRWQSEQSHGYWSSPEEEEVRFRAGSQRKANSWIFYSSDEEEATRKRVKKHMPNQSSMGEEGRSAALKRRGRHRISNCKARPKKEDTTKGVRKHKSKCNNEDVLKIRAEKRLEIMNSIAEARKRPSEDMKRTHMFSQQASYYHNRKHRTKFVLQKPLMANMVDLGDDRILYHVNFTAKIPDERDAVLFFSEVEEAKRLRVRVCTMLDANIEIETTCRGCPPELMLQHPAGGFNSECQRPYMEHWYYCTSEGEIDGFRFKKAGNVGLP